MQRPALGVIVGNRGFFPDHLCEAGRRQILAALKAEGIDAVTLGPEDTKFGSVETLADARRCAALFKEHRDDLWGVLVTLPNFGDERGVATTLRLAGLGVPVLVHAFPDEARRMTVEHRRDSFCGKISVCNNLVQYGIPFSLTSRHTMDPDSPAFRADLRRFVATCNVVRGLRRTRIGALGARPAAFNTVRYSEKLLERAGITVETLDLSEVFGRATALGESDSDVRHKLDQIQGYAKIQDVPPAALLKMAKLGVVVDRWIADAALDATAIQCWTAMEEFFGVVPCTIMSILSDKLLPSACETDVAGVVGMYALQLASGQPSALVDWNNNYEDDPDKAVVFHCSNLPKQVFSEIPRMEYQAIIAGTVGRENTYGTVVGRIRPEPFTFCRVMTDDATGAIAAYVGEGEFTHDPLQTFGGYGVVRIPGLQGLLAHICRRGYEHHVAVNLSQHACAVAEAMERYLGWEVYRHEAKETKRD
ncbi:MAG: fucose isomerase [Chloroflexi bacterium]|nr:fucose isomerase [Chloroflexota bacterium]